VTLVKSRQNLPWIVLIASVLVCLGVWYWAESILAPANTAQAQSQRRPMGNNSDLYARWLGTRELLLYGRDPYSAEVTREIQMGFYGRPLDPRNPSDPSAKESFVYPLYVAFLLAPFAALPFPVVQAIFRILLLAALAGTVPLWMIAVRFRPGWRLTFSGMVLTISTFAAVLEWHQQNLAALVVFLLAAAAASVCRNWLGLSGFLLALATVKPELAGLTVLWLLLWAAAEWNQRKRLIWSFMGTMMALLIAAEAVSPHWVGRFVNALRQYSFHDTDPSILQIMLPPFLAKAGAAVLIIFLAWCCWRWRKVGSDTEQFAWTLALVASVTLAVIPKLAAYNQPLLIPALLVLLAYRETTWKAALVPGALAKAVFLCLLWQWGTAAILSLCSFWAPASRIRVAAALPEYTLLGLPPIVLLAIVTVSFSRIYRGDPTVLDQRNLAVRHG